MTLFRTCASYSDYFNNASEFDMFFYQKMHLLVHNNQISVSELRIVSVG